MKQQVEEGVGSKSKSGARVVRAKVVRGGEERRLSRSEELVVQLQGEVGVLKRHVEELERENRRYVKELEAAHQRISSLEKDNQAQKSEFGDVRKLISGKLENLTTGKKCAAVLRKPNFPNAPPPMPPASLLKHSSTRGPPPPPPPPPSRSTPLKGSSMQKAPSLVEFYHSLTKPGRENGSSGFNSGASVANNTAHNSIVGEIQNRSSHLLAIKSDVETKGEFIKSLIEKVQCAAFTDMEDVSIFIEWLDKELSTLADESAVLKHFNWPERKADAMREAAFEYRAIKRVEYEVRSFEDNRTLTFEAALKKMTSLLDKSERSTQRLMKLRDAAIVSYGSCNIPTEWMLDSGIVSKIKFAAMNLAKCCMRRLHAELESVRRLDKEMIQEALLLRCVRFCYRVHQLSGGLDVETMAAFEQLRHMIGTQRRQQHLLKGIAVP